MNDQIIESLFARPYHRRDYNCAHFAVDIWRAITGEDIGPFIVPERIELSHRHRFRRVLKPAWNMPYPLLALMQFKNGNHIGVLHKGKVWHKHAGGAECMPPNVASRSFTEVRYYAYE